MRNRLLAILATLAIVLGVLTPSVDAAPRKPTGPAQRDTHLTGGGTNIPWQSVWKNGHLPNKNPDPGGTGFTLTTFNGWTVGSISSVDKGAVVNGRVGFGSTKTWPGVYGALANYTISVTTTDLTSGGENTVSVSKECGTTAACSGAVVLSPVYAVPNDVIQYSWDMTYQTQTTHPWTYVDDPTCYIDNSIYSEPIVLRCTGVSSTFVPLHDYLDDCDGFASAAAVRNAENAGLITYSVGFGLETSETRTMIDAMVRTTARNALSGQLLDNEATPATIDAGGIYGHLSQVLAVGLGAIYTSSRIAVTLSDGSTCILTTSAATSAVGLP